MSTSRYGNTPGLVGYNGQIKSILGGWPKEAKGASVPVHMSQATKRPRPKPKAAKREAKGE